MSEQEWQQLHEILVENEQREAEALDARLLMGENGAFWGAVDDAIFACFQLRVARANG